MGGDMANVNNSNLKVPPLKIVLSSATSGGSDRSSSTSPSSESESLDSNLTIISDNQQQQLERPNNKPDSQKRDESGHQGKLDKAARQVSRGGGSDQKTSSNQATIVSSNKRLQDSNSEIPTNSSNNESTANRDQSTSSNQRITRSSQRAAQQNKSESETNEELSLNETQEATANKSSNNELGQRKVKRRKGEAQESEQDNNQQVPQQPVIMANICSADYQLPSQNSFELYRDIRNRPYTKMMKLNLVQPRMPQGFKDYLLHSGPYLLDGNKVGVGVGGSRIEAISTPQADAQNPSRTSRLLNCVPTNRKKPSLTNSVAGDQGGSRLHSSYKIPKLADSPRHLKSDSPLFELFQDQERARHRMRIQHLKERERSVLSAEQEILRAYNRVAIADSRQPSHLSACTYFYYQERYHYIDEKSNYLDSINQRDSAQGRENSDSCNAENSVADRLQSDGADATEPGKGKSTSPGETERVKPTPAERAKVSSGKTDDLEDVATDIKPPAKKRKGEPTTNGTLDKEALNGSRNGCDRDMDNNSAARSSDGGPDGDKTTRGEKAIETSKCDATIGGSSVTNDEYSAEKTLDSKLDIEDLGQQKNGESISDADLKEMNKSNLIESLHEIDEKWAKIREEMFVRHRNESDSLYAVQCLEWEWKAKEVGACDVRLSPRIDSESVPRVDVSSLDY